MDVGKKNKFKINEGFIFQEIGKGITIFSSDESLLFTLNETAAYIFNLIRLGKGEEEIINRLVSRFEVDPDKAKHDVDSLILKFVHEGIVLGVHHK